MTLPTWVQQGAIAFDRSTNTCFSVCRVKRLRETGEILLMHQPQSAGDADAGHSLKDCKLAEVGDLAQCRVYIHNGLPLTLSFRGDRVLLHSPHYGRVAVLLPPGEFELHQAARSFAGFFNGEILPSDTPLPGEVSHAA